MPALRVARAQPFPLREAVERVEGTFTRAKEAHRMLIDRTVSDPRAIAPSLLPLTPDGFGELAKLVERAHLVPYDRTDPGTARHVAVGDFMDRGSVCTVVRSWEPVAAHRWTDTVWIRFAGRAYSVAIADAGALAAELHALAPASEPEAS